MTVCVRESSLRELGVDVHLWTHIGPPCPGRAPVAVRPSVQWLLPAAAKPREVHVGSETTPAASAGRPPHHGPDGVREADRHSMRLASVVLNVHNLEKAVSFYRELLGLEESADTSTAALLVGADGSQLYLRSLSEHADHPAGGIGVRCVFWTAPSLAELRRCEQVLKDRHAHIATNEADGFAWVEGRDPSGVAVAVSYPGPDQVARSRIISRVYAL
jgi:catechol 2,3-dioxygenase-like lactoylglutathione lyase family enzyme